MLKRNSEAVTDFTALIEVFPNSAPLYEWRASCYEALGEAEKAKADRETAVRLGTKNSLILNNQAWQLVTGPKDQRDPARALPLARKAVELEPANPLYHNTLGVALYRNGQFAAAVLELERSLKDGQGEADAFDLFFLAMCHHRLGDAAKANDYRERAVKWFQERRDKLQPVWIEELSEFQSEAAAVLAQAPGNREPKN